MFYLTMHSTRIIYGYMVLRTTQIVKEETYCHHMDYSFQLAVRVLLYASSHRRIIHLLNQLWSTGWNEKSLNGFTMKVRSDDPSHHNLTGLDGAVAVIN